MNEFLNVLQTFFLGTGVDIALHLTWVILLFLLTRIINDVLRNYINKQSHFDKTIPRFITTALNILLILIWGIFTLYVLFGVSPTSIVTIISVFTLGISLALQNVITSLVNGVLIITNKPFVEGEYIECNGKQGTVSKISIFNTTLKCYDGNLIVIPNSILTANEIINYSRLPTRRLDIQVPVSYKSNVDDVTKTLNEVIASQEDILKEPAPQVLLDSYGDSNLNFIVRVWTPSNKYWDVRFSLNLKVLAALAKAHIDIDYDQVDVNVKEKIVDKEGK